MTFIIRFPWRCAQRMDGYIKLLAILSLTPGMLCAGINEWTSIGPDGGQISALAIDPRNSSTVYAVTGRIYKSTDSGTRWSQLHTATTNEGGSVFSVAVLAIDPQDTNTLYAGGVGTVVLKSTDGGTSWSALSPLMTITPYLTLPNGRELYPFFSIRALVVDPGNSNIIYAGTFIYASGAISGGVFKSTDAGATWTPANSGLPSLPENAYVNISALAIDPRNTSTIYAATNYCCSGNGVFKSTDGGASWSAASSGPPNSPPGAPIGVSALAIDPQNTSTIYAGRGSYGGGVFKSTDGGASWTTASSGLPIIPNRSYVDANILAIDPQNTSTLYVATNNCCPAGPALFKSTNGAASWSALPSGQSCCASGLAIDPQNPSTVFAGTFSGVLMSGNGGASWSAANSGLVEKSVSSLAIDPQNLGTLYATASGELYKTTDGGANWRIVLPGLLVEANGVFPCCVTSVALDPQSPSTVYVGSQGASAGAGGVLKSTDRGASWQRSAMPRGGGVHGFALDPKNGRTLYAWNQAGTYKSTDGAATWTELFLSGTRPLWCVASMVFDPQNPNTIYARTCPALGGQPGQPIDPFGPTLYKSTDGGISWSAVSSLPPRFPAAVDPKNPSVFYAISLTEGVLKTTDGGESWKAVNSGLPTERGVHVLAIDPVNPNIVYGGSYGHGVFRTTDGGETWNAVNKGLTTLNVQILAIDPGNPNMVYAGIDSSGVFAITFAP